MSLPKLLVIENQFAQYELIEAHLGDKFDIYPGRGQQAHQDFLNLIRIYLNPGYGSLGSDTNNIRNRCFVQLLKIIKENKPEAILMDHILLGFHEAQDGIDLAKAFRNNEVFIPIIFLSRTKVNSPKAFNAKYEVADSEWLSKGIDGDENLNKRYLEGPVTEQIKKSIAKSRSIQIEEKIGFLLKAVDKLNELLQYNAKLVEFRAFLLTMKADAINCSAQRARLLPDAENPWPDRDEIIQLFEQLKATP